MIEWIMEILQDQSTPFQKTEKEKEKNNIKFLTPGCASWSAFPQSPGVASLPHFSTEPQRPHSLWDSAREEEEEDEDEENEDKGEEEAFNNLLNYWFHRDQYEKPFWLPSSLLLLLPQSCLSSSRSLPLPSLSCVSQSPSKVHHYYFPRLPRKPALAYGWKEMFPKSSCYSLNTPWTLPAIKDIVISPILKLTGINFLGLGNLFFFFFFHF